MEEKERKTESEVEELAALSIWTEQESVERASSYCIHRLSNGIPRRPEFERKVKTKQNRINRRVNKPYYLNEHVIKLKVTKGLS